MQKGEALKKGLGSQQHEGSSSQDQWQPHLSFVDRQDLTALNREVDVAQDEKQSAGLGRGEDCKIALVTL